jgi:hypothetical protein
LLRQKPFEIEIEVEEEFLLADAGDFELKYEVGPTDQGHVMAMFFNE